MARKDWESIAESRRPQAPVAPILPEAERLRRPGERLKPDERRSLMMRAAEQKGIVVETGAMLSLVRAVEGFTNMSAVYKVPDRTMIDAERVRGARTEAQARGRAWNRLHDRQMALDSEMQETGTGYVRPSDWFRLFAALKKATKPDGNIPNVFSVETVADRSVFRKWADQYGLDGDGLVRVAKTIRDEQEAKARGSFNVAAFIEKIQALSAGQLHKVLRAGFEPEDICVRSDEGSYIPLEQLPRRYGELQKRERLSAISAETDRLVRAAPSLEPGVAARDFRSQEHMRVAEEYDARHFGGVAVDRGSVGYGGGIVSSVFASTRDEGGRRIGYGYHGVIEPELINVLPTGYLREERGRPYVRAFDGKTVISVQRWLISTSDVELMLVEEVVQGDRAVTLEQAATRDIANAIVYNVRAGSRPGMAFREDIFEPFYWNDVHWVYKKLVENQLPRLAKLAGIDPSPLHSFVGEDAEREWMFGRIVSSGVTTAKQLNDKQSHFVLTLEDVFSSNADRTAIREAEKRYPESIRLGGHAFAVKYEWSTDGKSITKGVVEIERSSGFDNNAHWLEGVVPSDIPSLGTDAKPLQIIFRFQDVMYGFRHPVREFPVSRFRELLEILQPQERFLDQAWRRFIRQDPVGKMDIPLTVTAQDAFPTPAQLRMLMESKPESVAYVVDRDGIEHFAHATLRYADGDVFRIQYEKTQQDAEEVLAFAKKKHAQHVAAFRSREAMGGEALNEQLRGVRALQAEMDGYNSEFESDHLVAFVLGRAPFSEEERGRVANYLAENEIQHAETALKNRIHDRKDAQSAIDAMRQTAATVTELEALGFDWQRYNINRGNGDRYARRDHDGFAPGDIRLHKGEIYRPSLGRKVGHRVDLWRLQRELPQLQRRLDHELTQWKLKKGDLREGRRTGGPSDDTASGPEVVHRGYSDFEEDDEF